MKKILLLSFLVVFIPTIVIITNNKNNVPIINLEYFSNIMVRVKRLKNNVIEAIPLEEYIVGVLAGEVPTYFDLEAMKAQAVASRSYVLCRLNKEQDYDVVDSTKNQVYLDDEYLKSVWKNNYQTNINKLRQAVNETSGQYLEYDGVIADTLFFSTSNGYTEDSALVFGYDVPYLKSVTSNWDEDTSTAFKTTTEISLTEFYQKLSLPYAKTLSINVLTRSNTNRILTLTINKKEFTGREVYNALGLRSTDFVIKQNNDNLIIETIGFGHGVGMSQYGALGMAQNNFNYQEILSHYYQNTVIKKI